MQRYQKVIEFLISVRLSLLLLAIIIPLSFIGCFAPTVYYSWPFILILSLFSLNLFLCRLRQLKAKKKKLAPGILHFSILVILSGAAISAIWAKKGVMRLYEGETKDNFITDKGPVQLDFKIDLEDFNVEFYKPNEETIKEFRSRIRIIDKGNTASVKNIKVNAPVKYKGYTFYQSGYDPKRLNWTSLKVVRDPGVSFVFLGFILLNLGVIINFFLGLRKNRKGKA